MKTAKNLDPKQGIKVFYVWAVHFFTLASSVLYGCVPAYLD